MINPIYFYLIDIADGADTVLAIAAFITVTAALVLYWMLIADEFDDDENAKKAKRYCKRFAVIGAVCLVLAISIPTKQTMTEMLVAKYATEDNAKAIIDYIVETLEQLKW